MRSKTKDPLSAAFKPLTPIAPEAQVSGIAVVEHINRLLAPSHFQLKGCAWSPFGNFIAMPHLSEDVAKLPEVLPRILLDMFKVEFRHLTFDTTSFVVVYNLPLGSPGNWTDPSSIASALMAQNNILKPLPASPGRWLANPNRHKGASASLCLSLSPLIKAAIIRSGTLFFDGHPHPVCTFTAAKTKPNQCRHCWQLGHSEAWCHQTNPVCGTCAQGHPSHHHHACVNRHIQLTAQPPLPKKKPTKPSAASKRQASKVTAGASINVPSSTTLPSGNFLTGVFLLGLHFLIPHLLATLNAWANSFGISIDPGKTKVMWLFPDGRKPPPPLPSLNVVEVMHWLGVNYDQKLTFNAHVANILKKANKNMAPLFVIKRLSGSVSAAAVLRFYLGAIRPILTYSAPTWWTDKDAHGSKLNSYQYRLLNRCLGAFPMFAC
ncbi:hypothetical protein BOTBODRAFT_171278 [Botryobasidium botryosum FD-172 SS1]|uniref:Reverse transcriptase domain-containing protein n=1 Tax=Botryobasidium botryosum (strain FD-172 SS1) TaxID=930990 RepID=A0A067N3U9_BOTB1|nr:hypothetical protein BOTBODRAFT_171278 [Botryobasidium botryosum FD-172 SS1]